MQAYAEALLARGDYGRFFARDIEFEVMGTGQRTRGAQEAEQAIRFLHEVAFDAQPEIANIIVAESGAAVEAMFVGKHVGEFAGVAATGNPVRVPYSVFYAIRDGTITALRIYMPMDQLVAQIRTPDTPRQPSPQPDERTPEPRSLPFVSARQNRGAQDTRRPPSRLRQPRASA